MEAEGEQKVTTSPTVPAPVTETVTQTLLMGI
jgi:hypothetical protein